MCLEKEIATEFNLGLFIKSLFNADFFLSYLASTYSGFHYLFLESLRTIWKSLS